MICDNCEMVPVLVSLEVLDTLYHRSCFQFGRAVVAFGRIDAGADVSNDDLLAILKLAKYHFHRSITSVHIQLKLLGEIRIC